MRVHTATTPLPATTTLGRNPTPSTSTTTLCPNKNIGTKTQEMVDRLVPFQHIGKAGFSPLCATNRDENPTNVYVCMYVYMYVCTYVYLLNCTKPRNPALSFESFYATRIDPPKGGSMILVTKTSDQTRQRGHTLSTCTNLT